MTLSEHGLLWEWNDSAHSGMVIILVPNHFCSNEEAVRGSEVVLYARTPEPTLVVPSLVLLLSEVTRGWCGDVLSRVDGLLESALISVQEMLANV